MSIFYAYEQVEHWIRNEERYIKNLKSIMDARSFSDLMNWYNRSLYIARESERVYANIGVKIGKKKYDLSQIDEIPDALRNEYVDRFWDDLSEEERYKAWTSMGLAPGNYMYMKSWQEYNNALKKNILAYSDISSEEMNEATARNRELLSKYTVSGEDLDANEIDKNSGASLAHIELVLREMTRVMSEKNRYDITRDQLLDTPPNGVIPSTDWNHDKFKQITSGSAKDNFEDL
jgi:hypothetical protein